MSWEKHEDIVLRAEIFNIFSSSPRYFYELGYLEDNPYEKDGRWHHAYSVSDKGFREFSGIALRRRRKREFAKSIKKQTKKIQEIIGSSKEPTLLDLLGV